MLNGPQLGKSALRVISDATNPCLMSPVSHWEMAIKISAGKLRFNEDFTSLWQEVIVKFGVLHIELRHTSRLLFLPNHHKDPFDRMLAAQALVEQIPIVSADSAFDAYGIRRIW
jgi:PIN domain nuclease of toxin-antitoxin system